MGEMLITPGHTPQENTTDIPPLLTIEVVDTPLDLQVETLEVDTPLGTMVLLIELGVGEDMNGITHLLGHPQEIMEALLLLENIH